MALAKQFYGSYQSINKWDYYLEIWVEGFGGSPSEILIGQGGPVINYDTDSEDRFNPILASTLKLPLVVKTETQYTDFFKKLYQDYVEQDVYIHLYQATDSTYSSQAPLWSGFVIMDLATREDLDYPYEMVLTATDGLALLKDRDWTDVDDWPGSPPSPPYNSGDVNWGPASFRYWIHHLISRTGMAKTTEGASEDWEISTSVNWYNLGHAAPAKDNDPLSNTIGKMTWTHNEDANNVFTVTSCYDALREIMRAWGCRITYWNHCFYIVQIGSYDTAESGTLAAPVNIMTRRYNDSQALLGGGSDFLGTTTLARYQLSINNNNIVNGIPSGILSLSGAKYNYYPRLKQVKADFVYGANQNYFGGFTEYMPSTTSGSFSSSAPVTSPVAQQSIIDLNSASSVNLNFRLNMRHQNTTHADLTGWMRWTMRAYNAAGDEKFLRLDSSTATGFDWVASIPAMSVRPLFTFDIYGSYTWQIIDAVNADLPTHADFSGLWNFEIITYGPPTNSWATGNWTTTGFYARPVGTSTNFSNPWNAARVKWENAPNPVAGAGTFTWTINADGAYVYTNNTGNPFDGSLQVLNASGGMTAGGNAITNTINVSNSEVYHFGALMYGDTEEQVDAASLQVSDDGGSTFTQTNFAGKWGEGTVSGTTSFTQMLMGQFISGQAENTQILNCRLAISQNGKETTFSGTDYPNYVNPIGRLLQQRSGETDKNYVFRRGAYHTALDEWDYEGWEIQDNTVSPSVSSRLMFNQGDLGQDYGGANAHRVSGATTGESLANEAFLGVTSAAITSGASVTSIPINAIGTAILKTDDVFTLIDPTQNNYFILTMAADLGASDTSLTIDAYDFSDYPDISMGSYIYLDSTDLVAQYQHKTKGTIGGMAVTANSIDGATTLGRESVFFRFEGDNLSSGTYYVSNGEDNNKSGRWGSTNTNAPSTIGTQRAIKSGRFVADDNYLIEAGSCVASGTSGVSAEVLLYKTTPVDGATAATAMTLMGKFTIALNTDARTQVDEMTDRSTAAISKNDVIIPHIYSTSGSTYDLRGLITFKLKRYTAS